MSCFHLFRFALPLLVAFAVISSPTLSAQNQPVIVEAESGVRGAEFAVATQAGVQYVSTLTNSNAQNPVSAARVISYSVTFPAAGAYELYARVRVGVGTFDDDSFFYGNGFGAKAAANDDDWIIANGLGGVGFSVATDTVTEAGTVQSEVWKWIKLSDFNGGEAGIRFTVAAGALTQTFQIGAREDGLWLDKFAFGRLAVGFTVENLDNGEPGTSQNSDPGAYTPVGPPLATGKAKFLGCAYNTASGQGVNFDAYWNQVTPENGGKWGAVEAVRDVMNWASLDEAYNYAKSKGFPFKMHTLVWGSQQPTWIETLPAAEQLREIEDWYKAVAARYPDLDLIEVVNEPIHAPPSATGGKGNYLAALGGTGASGWEWVLRSFRMARLHFPNARLALNEYSVTNSTATTQSYAQLVQLLKNENLIDAVGIQQHAFETRVSAATILTNLNTVAAPGVPLYITELDIDGATDQIQLDDYKRLFPLFWEHPAVKGVTMWGYRPGLWRTEQGAYIVLANGGERPAMLWLKAYMKNTAPMIAPAQVFAVREGSANGASAGMAQATDGDAGTTFQAWQITGGTGMGRFAVNATTGEITVANAAGLVAKTGYTLNLSVGDGFTTSAVGAVTVVVTNSPVISVQPVAQAVALGGSTSLSATAIGTGPFTYQWKKNGADLAGATSALLGFANVQPADAGVYSVVVTNASGSTSSGGAVVGISSQTKVVGTGYEFAGNITHQNGNVYDQILLTGSGATITADPGQIVRTSYIDLNDDIVQIEFSGAGALTITLANATGPAIAASYNQPTVQYMKGHASLTLVGATEATHLSVFTVGSFTAVNQALFKVGIAYDGVADLALLAVASPTGRLGSIRFANTELFAASGLAGVFAPGVRVGGPVNIHNVSASGQATPVLVTGAIDTGRIGITGGDMLQPNARAVQVDAVQSIAMLAGATSHNAPLPAQTNRGVYERNGLDVTSQLVTGP